MAALRKSRAVALRKVRKNLRAQEERGGYALFHRQIESNPRKPVSRGIFRYFYIAPRTLFVL
ncbi:hypothetical protein AG1IA_01063 [Rhizoctonia solani AG-1 IA]|uniref:Uncharacterized protein n=1 Tax=Thanatephorus cucumeris (strain AG1-IA) TaxID=983506 RepID=L8X792_THACA|nr:hypothetical protein AG1IA_01063 [Rhizoctonia solani AG-1 IA]